MFKKSLLSLTACAVTVAALASANAMAATGMAQSNQFWWPETLDLTPLRQHTAESNPLGEDFDYAAAFQTLDLDAVKADIDAAL